MTLWRDLIDIPEHVSKGDFVLSLADGVQQPSATLKHYVVTDNLVEAFAEAMALIDGAMASGKSKATFLHGSFGSGKSHFMAVLHQLLAGDDDARSIAKLAPVVTKYDHLTQHNYLLVPFHLIGASSLEAGILGGYMRHVERKHPTAAPPAFMASDAVIDNARSLRNTMGDEAFFTALNAGNEADDWGDYGTTWDATAFDEAADADGTDPRSRQLRAGLVSALVGTLLTGMRGFARDVVHGTDENASDAGVSWVGLDAGLEAMSQHARSLSYDGVVLFLDELILWLASKAGDVQFLNREAPKVSKLVEAQSADRPVPIISFIARQRELTDFIGEGALGAEYAALHDALQWWSGRFGTITLEDRNLPAIVSRRLLAPRHEQARATIDGDFEKLSRRLSKADQSVLLAEDFDQAMFRMVYPFTPALVKALVALSSALQRERTALRLLSTLLSERRDDLALGEAVPVGDLWMVVSKGEEPFTDALKAQFKAARRLWDDRLRPTICATHGTTPEQVDEWRAADRATLDDAARRTLQTVRNDERIACTLLIASLVPEVPVLKELTATRLAALNHGAVHSPIPGTEASIVTQRLRKWAQTVTELHIGNESDPKVSLKLSSVDLDAVLDFAAAHDNPGNRRRLIKEFLYQRLEVKQSDELFTTATVDWRGGRREARVWYGNVRTLDAGLLEGESERWTVLIDYPFDEDSHSPSEDKMRLDHWRDDNARGALTIAWLPDFLSAQGNALVGRILKVKHTLHRFDDAVRTLPPADRDIVRTQLQTHLRALEHNLEGTLLRAYHLSSEARDEVDPNQAAPAPFVTLANGHSVSRPAGASFAQGLTELLRNALAHQYPAAPNVPDEVIGKADLTRACHELVAAFESPDKSHEVADRNVRQTLSRITEPLGLGKMGDTRFGRAELGIDALERAASAAEAPLTVATMRAALDPNGARTGLPRDLQDLVLTVWAAATNRGFRRGGLRVEPGVRALENDATIERESLPSDAAWAKLTDVLPKLVGLDRPPVNNARRVAKLDADVRSKLDGWRTAASALPEALKTGARQVGMSEDALVAADRYRAAVKAADLVARCPGDAKGLLEHLAGYDYGDYLDVVGSSLSGARDAIAVLERDDWHGISALAKNGDADPRADLVAAAQDWFLRPPHVKKPGDLAGLKGEALDEIARRAGGGGVPPVTVTTGGGKQRRREVVADAGAFEALLPKLRATLEAGGSVLVEFDDGGEA